MPLYLYTGYQTILTDMNNDNIKRVSSAISPLKYSLV